MFLMAETGSLPRRFRESRLIKAGELRLIEQASVLLAAADELDSRMAPNESASKLGIFRTGGDWKIVTPGWSPVSAPELRNRWHRAFGNGVRIERGEP